MQGIVCPVANEIISESMDIRWIQSFLQVYEYSKNIRFIQLDLLLAEGIEKHEDSDYHKKAIVLEGAKQSQSSNSVPDQQAFVKNCLATVHW